MPNDNAKTLAGNMCRIVNAAQYVKHVTEHTQLSHAELAMQVGCSPSLIQRWAATNEPLRTHRHIAEQFKRVYIQALGIPPKRFIN